MRVVVQKYSQAVVHIGPVADRVETGIFIGDSILAHPDTFDIYDVDTIPAGVGPRVSKYDGTTFSPNVDEVERVREEGREEIRAIVREAALDSTIDGPAKQKLKDKGVL